MASKLLRLCSLLLVAGSAIAGVVVSPYAYQPYVAAAYHAQPAPTFYTTANHLPVYHQAKPVVYHQYQQQPAAVYTTAPVLAKHIAPVVATKTIELESAPRYDFSYGVHDSITGDIKNHVESRDGGNVAGSYSVFDADGFKRTVTYTADDVNGFNAVVQREPIQLAKVAAVAHHAPLVSQHYVPAVTVPQHHVQVPQAEIQHVQHQYQEQPQFVQQSFGGAEEPRPVEYPSDQDQQQQAPVEQPEQQPEQQSEQEYPQNQQFPPYPEYDGSNGAAAEQDDKNDSDVVEVRTSANSNNDEPSTTPSSSSPAPVSEENVESNETTTKSN